MQWRCDSIVRDKQIKAEETKNKISHVSHFDSNIVLTIIRLAGTLDDEAYLKVKVPGVRRFPLQKLKKVA